VLFYSRLIESNFTCNSMKIECRIRHEQDE
jgi:hypothetical protein